MKKSFAMVCPRIQAKLEIKKEEVVNCFTMHSTNLIFQVNHKMGNLIIDLDSRSCVCKKWDLCGIPCCHAVSCIYSFARMLKTLLMIVIKGRHTLELIQVSSPLA